MYVMTLLAENMASSESSKSPPSKKKRYSPKRIGTCVIHYQKTTDKTFTYFSDLTDPQARLQFLKQICDLRQKQPANSPLRMDDECKNLPNALEEDHGYH